MSLPIKNSLYKYTSKFHKYIIIHHTDELKLNTGSVLMDRPSFQLNSLAKSYYDLDKMMLPYHFIIEKVGDEYINMAVAPLLTKQEFLDMDDKYQNGIHIALLGNYNMDTVDRKLYDVLNLILIIPMMKTYNIQEDNILRHSDVSFLPDNNCPGENFNLAKLKNSLRSHMKKRSVTRS